MNPEKMIWNSVSSIRRNSTYISLEYVINDIGIFCKGEQRSKSLEFVSSPMGEPLGLKAVDGTDYAAKPLGKTLLTWEGISDVTADDERSCIIVKGENEQVIVLQYDELGKAAVLSFIDEMRSKGYSCPDADAWRRWAADYSGDDIFAPLEVQIEKQRALLRGTEYVEEEQPKESGFAMPCPYCNFLIKHEEAKYCSNCGKKL